MRNPLRRIGQALFFPQLLIRHLRTLSIQNLEAAVKMDALRAEMRQLAERLAASEREARRSLGGTQGEVTTLCDAVLRMIGDQKRGSETLHAAFTELRAALEARCSEDAADRQRALPLAGNELPDTAARLEAQVETLAALTRRLQAHESVFPASPWTPDQSSRVLAALRWLTPHRALGQTKTRFGRNADGGYVMLDDFRDVAAALSLGVAEEISWDLDVATRGLEVLQFDHSVAPPDTGHPRIRFWPLAILPEPAPGGITIPAVLAEHVPDPEARLILKMDIEGAEWAVLESLPEPVLRRFSQIVCEFHALDQLADAPFAARATAVLSKLGATHRVIHVHGNNCGNLVNVANIALPQVLEVTFASRDVYEFAECTEHFPTALDHPNQPGRADLYLGRFSFPSGGLA